MHIYSDSAVEAPIVLTKNLVGVALIGLGFWLGALDALREHAVQHLVPVR